MGAANTTSDLFRSVTEMPDPGSAGTITVNRSPVVCNLVSAAAETRTLANPTRAGAILILHMRTDGGDITVTASTAYTEAGATTMVFANVGEFVVLVSLMTAAGAYFWRAISNSNIANNSLITQGAALTAAKPAFTIADAEGTPDEAIQAVTQTTPFGFVNAAELITLLYKVQNMHVRVGEIEARLEAAGIVAAN